MFRLLRYFSIASLLSIIVASVCLSTLYRKIAIDDIVRLGESGNTELTQVFANAFDDTLRSFIARVPTLSTEQLRADAATARLHASVRAAVAGTAVIKVKAYTLDGRTVYSSEARQIGEDKRANAGFLSAAAGKAVTEITHRDHFSAFEGSLSDRGVLSTYVPLRFGPSQRIEGVFELYQDITPFLDKVNESQRTVVAGVVAILLALYGVLFLIVRRADRILRRQEADSLAATAAVRAAHSELTERSVKLEQSEARNRQHADFLHALLNALPVGVSLVDSKLEVVVANDASLKLLQLPAEVYRQGVSLESVHRFNAARGEYGPGDLNTLVEERMTLARERIPHRFERARPDGIEIEVRGVPLVDGSMVTTYTDITDRKRAERTLLAAKEAAEAGSHAKSAFLAVMSHEIRTPMNAVIGLLELLSLSPLGVEQRDTVATVRDSSKSLLRLIDDVLDFSKIEAGKLELHEEAASMTRMLDLAQQGFSGVASQKGIVLVQRVDARLGPLVVDRLRFRQIVNNLLSNAIKFTHRGQVELALELVERGEFADTVSLCVRDTGVGMDAAALARLFQPFSQADSNVERRYGGTGLGLAICQRLAELMGAKIEVSSAPGVGTSFALKLVLRRASQVELEALQPPPTALTIRQAIAGRTAPTVEAARAAHRLVLVVDDHPVNRRMLARQLNTLGHAVQTAADGQEALEVLRGGGFGLVVTDCQMPVMDGYQLARAIRAGQGTGARLPIVACTANVSREAFDQCRAVGMDDVLAKPVELVTLDSALQRWLPLASAPTEPENPAKPVWPEDPVPSGFAEIAELAQGDVALARELLDDFRQANAGDIEAAAQALRVESADAIRRAAHRIKGGARTVGAVALARAAATLEQAAQVPDWQRVRSAWPAVAHESERLDKRIVDHGRQSSEQP